MNLTAEYVRSRVRYSPDTGELVWHRDKYKYLNGQKVGYLHRTNDRYAALRCTLGGQSYMVHRLIWLYMTGEVPDGEVDHIDHNPLNNKFSNLRLVDRLANNRNAKKRVDNTSGVTGVYKNRNRWEVFIGSGKAGKSIYIGSYKDFEEAVSARLTAQDHYGYDNTHGDGL